MINAVNTSRSHDDYDKDDNETFDETNGCNCYDNHDKRDDYHSSSHDIAVVTVINVIMMTIDMTIDQEGEMMEE